MIVSVKLILATSNFKLFRRNLVSVCSTRNLGFIRPQSHSNAGQTHRAICLVVWDSYGPAKCVDANGSLGFRQFLCFSIHIVE
jgi:hypothetical protein